MWLGQDFDPEVALLDTTLSVFVGIDWANQSHVACALKDDSGPIEASFDNTPDGIARLADWALELARSVTAVRVAIEVPHGPVVEGLLMRGFRVFAINPKQLDRQRDRYTVAGAKDDRRDAFVLADSLRLDPRCFAEVTPPPEQIIRLRSLSRRRESLVADRRRLANQLRAELLLCAPHFLSLCPGADDAWFWKLLKLVGEPGARHLEADTVAAFVASCRLRKFTAEQVLAVINMPALQLAPGTLRAAHDGIRSLLRRLQPVVEELRSTEREIQRLQAEFARECADVDIIDSYPGVGLVVLCGLLAEGYHALAARDLNRLRAQAGCAPVTRRSGKSLAVSMRRAVNPHLREAVRHLAEAAYKKDQWAKTYYSSSRARGRGHERSLRGLGDRILQQLIAMLKRGTPFDPGQRRGPVLVGPPGLTQT